MTAMKTPSTELQETKYLYETHTFRRGLDSFLCRRRLDLPDRLHQRDTRGGADHHGDPILDAGSGHDHNSGADHLLG